MYTHVKIKQQNSLKLFLWKIHFWIYFIISYLFWNTKFETNGKMFCSRFLFGSWHRDAQLWSLRSITVNYIRKYLPFSPAIQYLSVFVSRSDGNNPICYAWFKANKHVIDLPTVIYRRPHFPSFKQRVYTFNMRSAGNDRTRQMSMYFLPHRTQQQVTYSTGRIWECHIPGMLLFYILSSTYEILKTHLSNFLIVKFNIE